MPHIIVKLWPGRTEEQKADLSSKITKVLKDAINVSDSSISVAIEEVPEEKWKEMVYDPEIIGKKELLYKKPGYTLSE
ncbi:MAG TPA: 4-oxalocrotonate tautomerase [Actinobacteria bacterium]|nr:4-oxalocrotonate tautomerase [Actinomycetota bacterium]